MKPARLRPQAKQDLSDEAHYYAVEGGMRLGYEFEEAAVEALGEIERMPGLGSPRLGLELEMHGLRAWRTGKFPLSWFYFERHDHLDVARLLSHKQNIASLLGDDPGLVG